MLMVWALLLIASISDAASLRRPVSSRHFSAPLLSGHAQQTRLPHSHNSATRTAAHSGLSPVARSLRGSGSPQPRQSPSLFTAASSKKKKKEPHMYFLRLKPNKAVPAVSTTTPKPTEAPIFIIKSTPHPGEPPVFIVKTTPVPKPPAPWPSSKKPGHHRPTMDRPRPPAHPTTSSKPQSVHYHWHLPGASPIVPHGPHHIKYIVKTKTSYPRVRPSQALRPPPPARPPPAARPKPQPIKQPPYVHHTHQHLHHHLVPATHIIVRKRPQGPPPPPNRRPWGFF